MDSMEVTKIEKAIRNCDREIAMANSFGQRAQMGSLMDRKMAGLWVCDWESEKARLVDLLTAEVRIRGCYDPS